MDLSFLEEMPLEAAKAWLGQLAGVGPKTAACVLMFSFGRPAMPVDTHVHRVARRLGLIGEKVSAEQAHKMLEGAVAPEQVYPFHVNLIEHGRRLCQARRPRCEECILNDICTASRVAAPAAVAATSSAAATSTAATPTTATAAVSLSETTARGRPKRNVLSTHMKQHGNERGVPLAPLGSPWTRNKRNEP